MSGVPGQAHGHILNPVVQRDDKPHHSMRNHAKQGETLWWCTSAIWPLSHRRTADQSWIRKTRNNMEARKRHVALSPRERFTRRFEEAKQQ